MALCASEATPNGTGWLFAAPRCNASRNCMVLFSTAPFDTMEHAIHSQYITSSIMTTILSNKNEKVRRNDGEIDECSINKEAEQEGSAKIRRLVHQYRQLS